MKIDRRLSVLVLVALPTLLDAQSASDPALAPPVPFVRDTGVLANPAMVEQVVGSEDVHNHRVSARGQQVRRQLEAEARAPVHGPGSQPRPAVDLDAGGRFEARAETPGLVVLERHLELDGAGLGR